MVFGRVTALGMALKKKLDRNRKETPQPHYLEKYVEEEESRIKKIRVLRYRKYPIAVCFFGFMMAGSGITALVFILQHRHLLFEEFDHLSLAWKYLICFAIILVGLISLGVAEIYTIVINKKLGALMTHTKSILGRSKYQAHVLTDFKQLTIVRRGHISRDLDTSTFTIVMEFEDGVQIDTIYDRHIQQIKKKYAEILIYLGKSEGVNFGDIKYLDQCTCNYKFVYQSPFTSKQQQQEEDEDRQRQNRKHKMNDSQQMSQDNLQLYSNLSSDLSDSQDSDESQEQEEQEVEEQEENQERQLLNKKQTESSLKISSEIVQQRRTIRLS